jgi:anti-sigma factor RsiW
MTDPVDNTLSDDALLTAYIDGELAADERAELEKRLSADAVLGRRLAALKRGGRDFAGAFDVLLAGAPNERLTAILAQAAEQVHPAAPRRNWRAFAIAASVALFVLGAAAGYLVPLATGLVQPVQVAQAPNWRQAVAEYMGFMTPDTLAIIADDPAALAGELSAVGEKVSVALSPDRLALPDAALKRASLYDFHGKPLAQLAYLSPAEGAFAFCIIANGKPDQAVAFEEREGFNIVFWNRNGLGYMLIGKAARATLEAFAGDLKAQVS